MGHLLLDAIASLLIFAGAHLAGKRMAYWLIPELGLVATTGRAQDVLAMARCRVVRPALRAGCVVAGVCAVAGVSLLIERATGATLAACAWLFAGGFLVLDHADVVAVRNRIAGEVHRMLQATSQPGREDEAGT